MMSYMTGLCAGQSVNAAWEADLNLEGKKVLVVGLAKTGLAVSQFLASQAAQVVAADLRSEDKLGAYAQKAYDMGISLELGPHEDRTFLSQDLIVVSPGVPEHIQPLEKARDKGIPVIGEMELAVRYLREPVVAVTGTNGKTTTTKLVGEMLRASGLDVFVGGNIGFPLIELVSSHTQVDVVVAEVSSFQLDTMVSFRPRVGVLLNIGEDHLDRYRSFDEYVLSKRKLFDRQRDTDFAVLNKADPFVRSIASNILARKIYFNGDPYDGLGVEVNGQDIICRLPGKKPEVFNLSRFSLKGRHNIENACAACLAALAAGASAGGVQRTLETFQGLHHRLEYVRTIRGTHYFNDSKGTNVDAVVRALESFDVSVILIMGGRDKGGDYGVLKRHIKARVKDLIVIGEASEKILGVLGRDTNAHKTETLEEAVHLANKKASPGDVVLLSPGCSSFDMFDDYVQRGEAFCNAVNGL